MTHQPPDDWSEVTATWRRMPAPAPRGRDIRTAAGRRLRLVTALDLLVALLLLWLAVSVIAEHGGWVGWLVGTVLAAQTAAIVALAWMQRVVVTRMLSASTREFLEGWVRSSRRQLGLIRGVALLLAVELIMLVLWIAAAGRSGGILAQERWWYVTLVAALGFGIWLGRVRSRTLAALAGSTRAQEELRE